MAFMFLPHTSSPEKLQIRLNYILFKLDTGVSVQNNWWEEEAWKEFELVANSFMFSFCLFARSKIFLSRTPWAALQTSCVIPLEQDWMS